MFKARVAVLEAELSSLRGELVEAREALEAIRTGAVDALVVVPGDGQERVFTLEGSDFAYRALVEQMREGAATLNAAGTVLYANRGLAELFRRPLPAVIGAAFHGFFLAPDDAWVRERSAECAATGREGRTEALIAGPDGVPTPVALSFQAFDVYGTRTLSVIAADLTEHLALTRARARHEGEAALRASEKRYRDLVNLSPEPIAVHADGRWLFFNAAALELFGAPSPGALIGTPVLDRVAELDRAAVAERIQLSATRKGFRTPPMPFRGVRLDGALIDVETTSIGLEFEGRPAVMVIMKDIAERLRAKEARIRHYAILESINRILASALASGTEWDVGEVCLEAALGLTQSDLGCVCELDQGGLRPVAISWSGWETGEQVDASGGRPSPERFPIQGICGRVLTEGRALLANDPDHHPDRVGLPPGHPPLRCLLGVPLEREGHTTGLIAVANRPGGYTALEQETLEALAPAIVEAFSHKQAEVALRDTLEHLEQRVAERTAALGRANVTLRMIMACNQAISRAQDETQLIREICGIIRCEGGFRMVWVGLAESDPARTVRPVAADGDEEGYLEGIQITWADEPQGRGPTGTCIRLREVRLNRDFQTEPGPVPWRQRAAQHGFRSSLALPLIWSDQVFGALTIYSERVDGFEPVPITQLTELAQDLAYGIAAIRSREERDRALTTARHRADLLRTLASELVQTRQQEREKLAKVLHDNLQQLLVAAKYGIAVLAGRLKEPEAKDVCDKLDATLAQAVQASRTLATELNPPVLQEQGLLAALEWLARQMQERHGLTVEVLADAVHYDLAPQYLTFLFDAIRELLFNIVKHAGVARAKILMAGADGLLGVTVEDEGAGFDVNRIDGGQGHGGGLGLFSIRERLGHLGGSLWVESVPGSGSRFRLQLPLGTEPAPALPTDTDQGSTGPSPERTRWLGGGARKTRILLADDHPLVRQGLVHLLSVQADFEVVAEAGDGEEAVDLVRRLKPDVILMDISMPKLDGISATRLICQEFPDVAVIGLSMHEELETASAMRKAGAMDFVAKVGAPEELVWAIRAVTRSQDAPHRAD